MPYWGWLRFTQSEEIVILITHFKRREANATNESRVDSRVISEMQVPSFRSRLNIFIIGRESVLVAFTQAGSRE